MQNITSNLASYVHTSIPEKFLPDCTIYNHTEKNE